MNLRHTSLAPRPGTGRLGVVSGVLTIVGIGAAFVSIQIGRAMFNPDSLARIGPGRFLIDLLGAVSFTIGCFRTSRLLDRRNREGVSTALILFAAPLFGYVIGSPPSVTALSATLAGLVLLASVWRHLDR